SSLYTLTTEPPQVAASCQVSASGKVAAPCSCRLLSHQTLLWHHRLGHPSLPRLRGMHSRLLVSGLPKSLPPLPPSPAPPCLPCIEGRQRAAPHSSFPPTNAPLQTLHMDVWGPARVSGQDRERYFLLVVDNYTHYTTVFPLRSKGEVPDVFIPWIRTVRLRLRERFREDLLVLRLHSDRGGEFSSDLLRDFCRGEGILHPFTLPASPLQNGVAECHIGLPMEVAQTSPTLRWTGKVGNASVFWVWGSRAFVHDTSADKLSSHAIPYVFPGFPPDTPGWQFYHPTSRRVLPSQDVMFDESVPFYRLFPYRTAPLPPPSPLFLAPGPPLVEPLPPQGPAPSGVSQVDPLPLAKPVEVTIDSGVAGGGAARGAASRGAKLAGTEPGGAEPASAEPGGAEPEGAEPGGAETEGAEPGGAESEGADSGGAEPRGTVSAGGPAGASPRQSCRREPLSPQQGEWFARCTRLRSGAAGAGGPATGGTGAGGAGDTSPGGAGVTTRAGGTGGAGVAGPGGARTRGTEAAGAGGVGGARAGDPGSGGTGAGGAGAGGTGVGDLRAGGNRAGDLGARGASAGGARVGGAGAGDPGAGGVGAGGAGAGDPRVGGTGAGDPGAGGIGAGDPRAGGSGAGGAAAGGSRAGGTGAGGATAGVAGARGARAGGTGAGGTVQRRPYFVPPPPPSLPPPGLVLRQVLSLPSSTSLTLRLLCPPPHQTQPQL
ncbi:unnamed protein product, partial [Closterium sp. NIES-53]